VVSWRGAALKRKRMSCKEKTELESKHKFFQKGVRSSPKTRSPSWGGGGKKRVLGIHLSKKQGREFRDCTVPAGSNWQLEKFRRGAGEPIKKQNAIMKPLGLRGPGQGGEKRRGGMEGKRKRSPKNILLSPVIKSRPLGTGW